MLKDIIETIFNKSTVAALGGIMVLVGASCDPDRSFVPAMVALMVTGGAMVMYGILGGRCEEYEFGECEFEDYEFADPGDITADAECITDEGRRGA